MSTQGYRIALKQILVSRSVLAARATLSTETRFIFLVLADFAKEDGEANTSIKSLNLITAIPEEKIKSSVLELSNADLIFILGVDASQIGVLINGIGEEIKDE